MGQPAAAAEPAGAAEPEEAGAAVAVARVQAEEQGAEATAAGERAAARVVAERISRARGEAPAWARAC